MNRDPKRNAAIQLLFVQLNKQLDTKHVARRRSPAMRRQRQQARRSLLTAARPEFFTLNN